MWSAHPTTYENILICNLTIRSAGGNGDASISIPASMSASMAATR